MAKHAAVAYIEGRNTRGRQARAEKKLGENLKNNSSWQRDVKLEMANLKTGRRPNYFFKGSSQCKDYPSSLKIKGESEKKCFEIVGRKIELHERRRIANLNQFGTEPPNSDLKTTHTQQREHGEFECKRTTSMNDEYSLLADEGMIFRKDDDSNDETLRGKSQILAKSRSIFETLHIKKNLPILNFQKSSIPLALL